MNQQDRERIQQIITQRDIRWLVHFTPLENLTSIVENGLYSRSYIENDPDENNIINGICLDNLRADGRRNGICLSLSFPNHFMFYCHRRDYPTNWAVILLDINLILEIEDREIQFFPTNSANARFRYINNRTLETANAFEALFAEPIQNKRNGLLYRHPALLPKDPTDVQAEIMIEEHIERQYIRGVAINNRELIRGYTQRYPDIEFFYDSVYNVQRGLFLKREDCRQRGLEI